MSRLSECTPGPYAKIGPYTNGYLESGFLITTGYDVHPPEPEVGMPDGRMPLHGPMAGFSEADADLLAASYDHALLLAALVSCKARWEPFGSGLATEDRGEVCINGIRHATQLSAFGTPLLTASLRTALRRALGIEQKGTPND